MAACVAASGSAFGTVTLNFNLAFDGGVSSNFADKDGVVTNGLFFGVIVDANRNGLTKNYGQLTPALGARTILNTTLGVATDDILTMATIKTGSTAALTEGGNGSGSGGPGGVFSVQLAFGNGIGASDPFYLVWFDNTGTSPLRAGAMTFTDLTVDDTDDSWLLPPDGSLSDFDEPFEGTDPIRNASTTYTLNGLDTTTSAGLTFVPEPSAALLGALGALGLLRRRRN